jgi:hypothetical protein
MNTKVFALSLALAVFTASARAADTSSVIRDEGNTVIGPAIQGWPLLISNSVFNVVIVSGLSCLAMPLLACVFHN